MPSLSSLLVSLLVSSVIGASITVFDYLFHARLSVLTYPDTCLGYPFSCQYAAILLFAVSGVGIYLLYLIVVGLPKSVPVNDLSLLNGRPLSLIQLGNIFAEFAVAYFITGFFGGPDRLHDFLPYICTIILFGMSGRFLYAWDNWSVRIFVGIIGVVGPIVETSIIMLLEGRFYSFDICPRIITDQSPSRPLFCMGTVTPLMWLFPLYLNVACGFHRLILGDEIKKKQLKKIKGGYAKIKTKSS